MAVAISTRAHAQPGIGPHVVLQDHASPGKSANSHVQISTEYGSNQCRLQSVAGADTCTPLPASHLPSHTPFFHSAPCVVHTSSHLCSLPEVRLPTRKGPQQSNTQTWWFSGEIVRRLPPPPPPFNCPSVSHPPIMAEN